MKKIVGILCVITLCLTAFLPVFDFSAKAASATTKSSNEYVSSSTNYDKLRAFINTYGESGSSGKSITIDVPTSNGTISYILVNWSTGIGVIMHLSMDSPFAIYRTSFELTKSSKMIEIDHSITVVSLPSDSASNTITIDRSLHTNDSKYSLTNAGKYMSLADINNVFNSSLSLLLANFDEFLYENLGFGFGGLGFVSYIGYGDVACDIPSGYHGKKTEYVSNDNGTHNCVCEGCGNSSVANCTFKTAWESNSSQHWHACSVCGGTDTKIGHDYDNSCDTTCNTCGHVRSISHSNKSGWEKDSSHHWHECTVCGVVNSKAVHSYSNACDTTCNTCGYTRTTNHSYKTTWEKDSAKHWHKCSVCGSKKDEGNHVYDNNVDTTCNTCGYTRQVQTTPSATTKPSTTTPPTSSTSKNDETTAGDTTTSPDTTTTTDSTTAPDTTTPDVTIPDTTDSGKGSGNKGSDNTTTVIIIVVASVAVIGIGTALALILKKKK